MWFGKNCKKKYINKHLYDNLLYRCLKYGEKNNVRDLYHLLTENSFSKKNNKVVSVKLLL